jgi:uncharacterized protein (DUF2147 family)
MKTLSLLLMLAAAPAVADPIEGTWKTQPDAGRYAHVAIAPCGAAFCGVIVAAFDANGAYASPNLGRQLVIDMAPQGDGAYEGKVWRPSNDRIYVGKIRLEGNAMSLKGCVAGGLVCSSQTWSRVN